MKIFRHGPCLQSGGGRVSGRRGRLITCPPSPTNRDKTLMGLHREAQASDGPIRTWSYRVTNSSPLPTPSWLGVEGKSQDSRGTFAPISPSPWPHTMEEVKGFCFPLGHPVALAKEQRSYTFIPFKRSASPGTECGGWAPAQEPHLSGSPPCISPQPAL